MSKIMGSLLSDTIFGIPEIMPDNCQATFLGSSGIIFGISRLFLGYKKKPKHGNQGCIRVFKGVFILSYANLCYISQYRNHVNHPFKSPTSNKRISTSISSLHKIEKKPPSKTNISFTRLPVFDWHFKYSSIFE